MARHRVNALNGSVLPMNTAALQSTARIGPFDLDGSGQADVTTRLAWKFPDSAQLDAIEGSFEIPSSFSSTPEFFLVWTAPSGGANVVRWELSYAVVDGDNAETFDPASFDEASLAVDAPQPGTARFRRVAQITPATPANFTADASLVWRLARNAPHANDTMADIAILQELRFEYLDAQG